MKAYKGFVKTDDGKLVCRDMEYKVGRKYVYDGDINLCEAGYHACRELIDCLRFYPNHGGNVYYEVECGGDIIESTIGDGKFVCSEITLVREADMGILSVIDDIHDTLHKTDACRMCVVSKSHRYNILIDTERFLFPEWHDFVEYSFKDFVFVYDKNKCGIADMNGDFVLRGLDSIRLVEEDVREIVKDGKTNWFYSDGSLFSDIWYDHVYYERFNYPSKSSFEAGALAELGDGSLYGIDFKTRRVECVYKRENEPVDGFVPADCNEMSVGDTIRELGENAMGCADAVGEVVEVIEMYRPVVGVVVKWKSGKRGMSKLYDDREYFNETTGKRVKGFTFRDYVKTYSGTEE